MRIIVILLLLPFLSEAQKITIKQIKNNKAVIEFEGRKLQIGKSYFLKNSEELEKGTVTTANDLGFAKNNLIGISGAIISQISPTSSSGMSVSLTGRYGWNNLDMEFGPIIDFTSSSGNSSFGIGGFFDYNFTPNDQNNTMIWGVGLEGVFSSTSTGSSSSSYSGYLFNKWFLFTPSSCLRTNLKYLSNNNSLSNISYLRVELGINTYF